MNPGATERTMYPPDLAPFIEGGAKPVYLTKPWPSPDRRPAVGEIRASGPPIFYAGKMQSGDLIESLSMPTTIQKVTPDPEESRPKRKRDATQAFDLVVSCGDADASKVFIGTPDTMLTQNPSRYYVLIEHESYQQLVPVMSWYTFRPEAEIEDEDEDSSKVEKKAQQRLIAEQLAEARVAKLLQAKKAATEEESESPRPAKQGETLAMLMEPIDFGAENLRKEQLKKLKVAIRRKKRDAEKDLQDTAASSLAVHEIKKAKVDWDFEEGVATDDEEGAGISDIDKAEENEEDVEDSDEEVPEDAVLTGFGERVTQMLVSQEEAEADQELQQFSEDEEDEEADAVPGGQEATGMAVAQPATMVPLPSPSSTTLRQPEKLGMSTVVSEGSDSLLTESGMRAHLISIIKEHNGQIPAKKLIEMLQLNKKKDEKFQIAKKVLGQIAATETVAVDGQPTRVLKLHPGL